MFIGENVRLSAFFKDSPINYDKKYEANAEGYCDAWGHKFYSVHIKEFQIDMDKATLDFKFQQLATESFLAL